MSESPAEQMVEQAIKDASTNSILLEEIIEGVLDQAMPAINKAWEADRNKWVPVSDKPLVKWESAEGETPYTILVGGLLAVRIPVHTGVPGYEADDVVAGVVGESGEIETAYHGEPTGYKIEDVSHYRHLSLPEPEQP